LDARRGRRGSSGLRPPQSASFSQAWLPSLLRHAEARCAAAHPPPRRAAAPARSPAAAATTTADAGAWRIPTVPPVWCTPRLRHPLAPTLAPYPSCAAFFTAHLQPGLPLLLRGYLEAEGWSGLDYFRDLRALHAEHGRGWKGPSTLPEDGAPSARHPGPFEGSCRPYAPRSAA
jgi:hypothetical protein